MAIHHYQDKISCGKAFTDGTDFTTDPNGVDCGNCKRSKIYKAHAESVAAFDRMQATATAWVGTPEDAASWENITPDNITAMAESMALLTEISASAGRTVEAIKAAADEDRTDIPCVFCPDFTGTLVSVQAHTDDLHMAGDGSGRTREQYRADVAVHDTMYDLRVEYMISLGITDDRDRTAILEKAWDHAVKKSGGTHFYYSEEFNGYWVDEVNRLIAAFIAPEDADTMPRPFRASGKVKSTRQARRYRRGA